MKTLIKLAALVLACGCSSVSFADGSRFRVFRTVRVCNGTTCRTVPIQQYTPVQQYIPPVVQSTQVYVPTPTQYVYTESVPTFFSERPIAEAVMNTVQAPFLFFQENQPVRNVIKSIPPVCKDGKCPLK